MLALGRHKYQGCPVRLERESRCQGKVLSHRFIMIHRSDCIPFIQLNAWEGNSQRRRKDDSPDDALQTLFPILLKIGSLRLRETSSGEVQQDSGGGEDEGRELESTSEQKDPLREESLDDRIGRPPEILKYLLSWLTAELI